MRYEFREYPKGPVHTFNAENDAEVAEAARFWLDRAKCMPVRVSGGSEGWGYGLPAEVKPLLDAVQAERHRRQSHTT